MVYQLTHQINDGHSLLTQKGGQNSDEYSLMTDQSRVRHPLQIPSLIPVEMTTPHCQYPFELINRQCQLQCPSDHFMSSNPTIRCQSARAGYFRKPINGQCLPGESLSLEGCIKPLETCPNNFLREDTGLCVERCPEGYVPVQLDADFRKDNFLERRRTQVCQLIPISRL